jgi:2-oxoglutarate dehydrogenase E1 component
MKTSYLNDWNADLLDEYYQRWKQDPASVDSSWSAFFEGFELGSSAGRNGRPDVVPESERPTTRPDRLQDRVDSMVQNYRILGHTQAQIDPLEQARPETPALTLAALDLEDVPLDTVVSSRYFQQSRSMTLGELIDALRSIYCGPIGVEFMHILHLRHSQLQE